MSNPPPRFFVDEVSVETYSGNSAYGPVYATATTVLCRASQRRELVRNSAGDEVVSELTLYVQPDLAAPFTPESRITYAERVSKVLSVVPLTRPGETVVVRVTCQ